MTPDRGYSAFSKDFYEETENEINKILRENSGKSPAHFEIIRTHLDNMVLAFLHCKEQIEITLRKLELTGIQKGEGEK